MADAAGNVWDWFCDDDGGWFRIPHYIRLTIFCSYMTYPDRVTVVSFFMGNGYPYNICHDILLLCNPAYRNNVNKQHAVDELWNYLDANGPEGIIRRERRTHFNIGMNRVMTLNLTIPQDGQVGRGARRIRTVPGCNVP